MTIRVETVGDESAIAGLTREAFGGDYEVGLISGLRSEGAVILSLVAAEANEVRGHILFSRLGVEIDGREVKAAALAPMAVIGSRRNQGIGSRLVREGLEEMRNREIEAVFVLGHPAFYSRFGFSPEFIRKFVSPFHGSPHFMGLELKEGSLAGEQGSVVYAGAFGL